MTTRIHLWLSAMLLTTAATLHAQEAPCGVSTVKETVPLVYPPIARAAHVTGLVIVRTEFAKSGEVEKAEVWRGQEMLRVNTLAFVKGLKANEYGGSRTCLISVTFQMVDPAPARRSSRDAPAIDRSQGDFLRYVIVAQAPEVFAISDPAGKIVRKRFLGIF